MDDKCLGCQRTEVHKRCPAHGTPFYMSGVPYTKHIENIIKNYANMNSGIDMAEVIFRLIVRFKLKPK